MHPEEKSIRAPTSLVWAYFRIDWFLLEFFIYTKLLIKIVFGIPDIPIIYGTILCRNPGVDFRSSYDLHYNLNVSKDDENTLVLN